MKIDKILPNSFLGSREGKRETAKEKIYSRELDVRQLLEVRGKTHSLDRISDDLPGGVHQDNVDSAILRRNEGINLIKEKTGLGPEELIKFIEDIRGKDNTAMEDPELNLKRLLDHFVIDGKILSIENIEKVANYKDTEYGEQFLEEFGEEIDKLISSVGVDLHKDWQESAKEKGMTERIKPTKDEEWIKKNGSDKVDILNTDFVDLPQDWQKENLESAKVSVNFLYDNFAKYGFDDELIESAASGKNYSDLSPAHSLSSKSLIESASQAIHNAWRERKIAEGYNENDDAWKWAKELMVDYENLSEEEKEKDRKIFKMTLTKYLKEKTGKDERSEADEELLKEERQAIKNKEVEDLAAIREEIAQDLSEN